MEQVLGGLVVGAIAGFIAGMWWAEQMRRPTSQWHQVQFYRHNETGETYRLECRAELRDRSDVVVLYHPARNSHGHPDFRNEVWGVDEFRATFEPTTPELLKQ